jgi:hypothetical protein
MLIFLQFSEDLLFFYQYIKTPQAYCIFLGKDWSEKSQNKTKIAIKVGHDRLICLSALK